MFNEIGTENGEDAEENEKEMCSLSNEMSVMVGTLGLSLHFTLASHL